MAYISDRVPASKKASGFTLIELIITLAVLSILLGLAMPNLRGTIARNQLLGQANEMASAFALARNEAVTRGTQAGVCASANGTSCSGDASDWDKYVLVFADTNRNDVFNAPGNSATDDGSNDWLLRSFDANDQVDQDASAAAFYFNETGFSSTRAQGNIEVCHEKLEEHDRCRMVTIAPSGAITVVHKKASKA